MERGISNCQPHLIEVQGLTKSFGAKHFLKGLDLDIYEGESLAVIGGSGSGKSVLLKNIVGILTPDSGSIKIDGEEVVGVTGAQRERDPLCVRCHDCAARQHGGAGQDRNHEHHSGILKHHLTSFQKGFDAIIFHPVATGTLTASPAANNTTPTLSSRDG